MRKLQGYDAYEVLLAVCRLCCELSLTVTHVMSMSSFLLSVWVNWAGPGGRLCFFPLRNGWVWIPSWGLENMYAKLAYCKKIMLYRGYSFLSLLAGNKVLGG
jgi:hypothetical protein